jgi:hypothetical protein
VAVVVTFWIPLATREPFWGILGPELSAGGVALRLAIGPWTR